jgi:carbon monoxide dehydrogenase subunit G
MQLVHKFSVGAPLGDVWRAFNRPDLTASCLPGATVLGADGDVITGELKIKVGPLPVAYKGTVALRDRDDEAHRVVFDVEGADERGHGTIMATIIAAISENDARTDVELTSDLSITGRAARFGGGVIKDASERLLEQFESQLSARLASGELLPPEEPEPTDAVQIAGGTPPEAEVQRAVTVEPVRVRATQPRSAPARPAARPVIQPVRAQRPPRPYVYQPPSNLAEPHWDTLVRVGGPIVRRVGPPLAVATALGLLIVRLVRPREARRVSPWETARRRER